MKSPVSLPKRAMTRREFIRAGSLVAGATALSFPSLLRGQNLNNKVNIAVVGAGGKGASDTDYCSGENIVALCDVDKVRCAQQIRKYPQAKFYGDYRKMFDEMGKSIDAVIVATPDHNHAVVASAALQMGKHIYCQKPLTQTIFEARRLRDLAAEKKVVTQMGNQGSAEDGLRRGVEIIQAGVIGNVTAVHVWSNRPIWPQGMPRPMGEDPVPDTLDWNQWIGPAKMRPFKQNLYQPFIWRGWLDFGTGALGDMACHTVNLPFRAINMGYPTSIEAESSGMNGETYPLGSKIKFEFPERTEGGKKFAAATFHWYDGGKPKPGNPYDHDGSNKPASDITADLVAMMGEVPGSGCLIIGDKGKVFSPEDYGTQFFIKLKDEPKYVYFRRHPAVEGIPVTLPRNPFQGDFDMKHHLEWIKAIKDNQPEYCYSRFAITAYLTEIMLLGCVALRVGKKIEWDGPGMVAKNAPEAAQFVKRTNRDGWTV
jgi:predicted dehydrogenase